MISASTEPKKRRPEPDFIIGGAPKCGTTSLHFILDQHPDIALPIDEVNYFDADDPFNWPDLFFERNGHLDYRNPAPNNAETRNWYHAKYEALGNVRLLGEDSTRYLFSPMVPHRVAQRLPDAKIIFMLRDPVKRAYSEYWHAMKMMRVTTSFEGALTALPQIVSGSTYAPHLSHWINVLGKDRVHVVLLEDFQKDRQLVMNGIANFIGVEPFSLDGHELWFNKTSYPSSPRLMQWVNRLVGRRISRLRYMSHMRMETGTRMKIANRIYQFYFHKINPLLLTADTPPKMKAETAHYLSRLFTDLNTGLDTLLQRDLSEVWSSWDPVSEGKSGETP
ncbi:sulfotransferase [Celeribacter halophilus]|uniref:sulfotransferase n=1 Tax=Celeribacter halophilus TaxID=576117 RepID=UPI001C097ACF|nr:sulfotransferase [Celeribacter halophilus]MBU2888845.1 sulfotransferase domain-containing protein [Celeribacter halophilus]MDO6511456.1 sulfotransferase [Celeribacter halophilus]